MFKFRVLSIIISALSYYANEKLRRQQFNEAAENSYCALKREFDNNLTVFASLQAPYYTLEKALKPAIHILLRVNDWQRGRDQLNKMQITV